LNTVEFTETKMNSLDGKLKFLCWSSFSTGWHQIDDRCRRMKFFSLTLNVKMDSNKPCRFLCYFSVDSRCHGNRTHKLATWQSFHSLIFICVSHHR
jgi:hypothetical protein